MGKYVGPKCRLCRREGMKLFLKGARCHTPKCGVAKREYAPGQRSWRRGKMNQYGQQLREKQKVKRHFWVRERQFRRYFEIAARVRGNTGAMLLTLLERRLDNCLCRAGLGSSMSHARQLVRHGAVTVNDRKVDIPSSLLKASDTVKVHGTEKLKEGIKASIEAARARGVPSWLAVDAANFSFTLVALPTREEVGIPVQEQLIVELCSK